jgi:hypothetical protein
MGDETVMIRKVWWRNTEVWLHGLISAFVGGGASVVGAMIITPESYNIHELKKVFSLFLVNGIVSAALYLKQSPLPKLPKGVKIDEEANNGPISNP